MKLKNQLKYLVSTLKPIQLEGYKYMKLFNKLQVCYPTGLGKGYLLMVDIMRRIFEGESLLTVASHRLLLNSQHAYDIINMLKYFIKDIRFVIVGSDNADIDEQRVLEPYLFENNLDYNDIYFQTTKSFKIRTKVNEWLNDGKKVIVISTYHSLGKLKGLDIDTFYADEAHTLSSEYVSEFIRNFNLLTFNNSYFFTATPKDGYDEYNSTFLMNNEKVFGKRVGMTFKQAVKGGYITLPLLHVIVPDKNKNKAIINYNYVKNKVVLINNAYNNHRKLVKKKSSHPNKIEAKMLIKCMGVDDMWHIYEKLLNNPIYKDMKIYAGASRKGKTINVYECNGERIKSKKAYLAHLRNLKDTDKAIVLHFDLLSEGINVKSFTGVMFLSKKIPTIMKALQNIGRTTRLMGVDRKNLEKGIINTNDYKGWLKPYSYVILPVLNDLTEETKINLSKLIYKLRVYDEVINYVISMGNDNGSIENKYTEDNKDPQKPKNAPINIENLENYVENYVKIKKIKEEEIKEALRLNNMDKLELLKDTL